ncbi:MAG: HEAT repeat domain-containing protein, partial [Phycisphaerales bacterium]|nr:HEAT repeat domain-containing protein [Phycisphaerales bacterium]
RWLDILEKPSSFYSLTASAGKVPFGFGEPMIVTVVLKNNGPFDIALGPNGALRPDLWFDCSIKGGGGGQFFGVTFERFGQKLILRRNDTIEHTCRIDQGPLWNTIQARPEMSFPLYFSVFTNPVPSQSVAAPGPGGYRFNLKLIERQPTALMNATTRSELFKKLTLGDAGTKIRMQEMFAQFISLISQTPNADQAQETLRQLREAIEQGMSDPSPHVRAWAMYVSCLMASDPRRGELALRQAASKDWMQRVMVLTTVESLSEETRRRVLERLVNDEDEVVRQYALATRDFLSRTATTQPAGETSGKSGS